MIQVIPMSPDELGVLYKLFMANHQILDLKVERDDNDVVAMLHLKNNDTLYFPAVPFTVPHTRRVNIKESTDGR